MAASVHHARRVPAARTGIQAPAASPMPTIELHLRDAAATEAAGARLAGELRGGMVITLAGDLGAGKTTLVRGVLRAVGWAGPVKSPSYALVEHYEFSSLYFYHFDFYRFNDPDEWEGTGFAELFRPDSVCLVEWPERVADRLPTPDVALTLAHPRAPEAGGRTLTATSHTEAGERCLAAMTAGTATSGEASASR